MSYRGVAFNEVPDSENQIHGDEVGRVRFGFEGVDWCPGVTVSALSGAPGSHGVGPGIRDHEGRRHLVIEKPVYDGRPFSVEVTADRGCIAHTARC